MDKVFLGIYISGMPGTDSNGHMDPDSRLAVVDITDALETWKSSRLLVENLNKFRENTVKFQFMTRVDWNFYNEMQHKTFSEALGSM